MVGQSLGGLLALQVAADAPDIVRTLPDDAAGLWARVQRSGLPGLRLEVLTADRKPTHPVRLAHEELARAADGSRRSWPRVTHVMHLQVPDDIGAVVLDVVAGLR